MSGIAEYLRRQLPEIGSSLEAQYADLNRDLTPERIERLSLNLEGARRSLLTLREELLREEGSGDVG